MRIKALIIAALLSFGLCFSSFGGTWQGSDASGWTYIDDSGNPVKNQWVQGSGGLWYYLGPDGVMLHDTTTPDGYYVGPDGAWVENNSTASQSISTAKLAEKMQGDFTEFNTNEAIQYINFYSPEDNCVSFTVNFLGDDLPDEYACLFIRAVKEKGGDEAFRQTVEAYSVQYNVPLYLVVHYAYNGVNYESERGCYFSAKAEKENTAAVEAEKRRIAEEKERAAYETGITYEQLERMPDNYLNQKVKFTGQVFQVMEGGKPYELRLSVHQSRYGWYDSDKVLYCFYDPSIVPFRILTNDIITVYGTAAGLASYKAVSGATITLPAIRVDNIELKG